MDLQNKFKKFLKLDLNESEGLKIPIIFAIILVYIATVFVQNTYKLSLNSIIGFTIVMIIHMLVYIFSDKLFKNKYWLYFLVQGIIVFDCAVIMPKGYETIFLGIIPILIYQSMLIYYETIKVIITSIFFYTIFCGTIIILDGVNQLITYIPIFILITITVRIYLTIFLKQIESRNRTQKILQELQLAYEKVEELTLINERQRMARDLHDTLAQGLSGIIMQLEAANANLNNNNVQRSKEIIKKSMEYARKTLADSRSVIDDLRTKANEEIDFYGVIEKEIIQFKTISNIQISYNIEIESKIHLKTFKHIVYIVRESLNNVSKHSKANNVSLEIIENNNKISISIKDDGVGFIIKPLDQISGHYGILGITERVKAINGTIEIKSKRKHGTNISITIPITKGLEEYNE